MISFMKWIFRLVFGFYIWSSKLELIIADALRYFMGIAGPNGFGSKSTAEQVTEGISPSHLTAIITGATSGIGAETARVLAKRGVRLVMPARDLKKAGEVKKRIKRESPAAEIIVMEMDLSSFASIQNFSSNFLRIGVPLNILINNAGKLCRSFQLTEDKFEMTFATNYLGHYLLTKLLLRKMIETATKTGVHGRIINVTSVIHRWVSKKGFKFHDMLLPKRNNAGKLCRSFQLTEDKFEMTFATNYLGHYLLTKLLLRKMIETATKTGVHGRIINVTSVIHRWVSKKGFKFHDMLLPKSYNGTRAYALSKLANIMHAKEMARQLKERKANVTINSVHPGIVKTGIIRDHRGLITDLVFFLASKLLKSTAQGASTTCYVAISPQVNGISGKYFADCNESSCSPLADDDCAAFDLWMKTNNLVHKSLALN